MPRKYGFKSTMAIAEITTVPHPRWGQATERTLGSDERVPTQIFNDYAEPVAALYADRKTEKLFM